MSTNQQPVNVSASTKGKGNGRMLNVRGPKKPAFNLSAKNPEVAFLYQNQLLKMPNNLKKAASFLKKNGILGTDKFGRAVLTPDALPFVYVQAFEDQKVTDAVGNEHVVRVPLDSVETLRRNGNTLVQRNSESLLVRDVCELKTFHIEVPDRLDRGSIVTEEVVAYDNMEQLNILVTNITKFLHDLLSKEDYGIKLPAGEIERFIRKTIMNGAMLDNGAEAKLYTLNSAAPSQTRKGEAAFWQFAELDKDSRKIKALEALFHDSNARAKAVFRRFSASFKLQVFGTVKNGERVFKLDKDPKRLDMHASGSKPSRVHQELFGKMRIIKEFTFQDLIGRERLMTILESVKPMKDGVKRRIMLVEDIYIEVEQKTIVVKRPSDGQQAVDGIHENPGLSQGVFKFHKNMTDGGILVSHDVSKFLANEGHFSSDTQSFQARGANGVKPFAYTVHKLRELSEVDMILLGGARKLNVLPSLLDGTFELSVVQAARMEEEKPNTLVATQALLALSTPSANLEMLNMISTNFVINALHDTTKAKQLLNIEVAGESDVADMVDEELAGADMAPKERGIKRLLQESDIALNDFVQKKALLSIMAKPLEKIRKGHVFMKDTTMKHMGFDLYFVAKLLGNIVRDHEKGIENVVMVAFESIPEGKVLIVKYGGGLRRGTALLVRYPVLKHEEVQKVETAVEFSEEAQRYYEEASDLGFYQGLVLFNAFDMMSEAMSGADFDGDTCLVIFNSLVVKPYRPRTMMLDYFINPETNELEGGCPWSDPNPAPDVYEVLGDEMPEGLFVEQIVVDGFRTWGLKFKEEDVHQRPMAVYYVFNRMAAAHIIKTSKESSIGRWTNILMNVEDILLELKQELALAQQLGMANKFEQLQQEYAEYENLAKWLVYVVRWAIDEAKHGGAFSTPLAGIIGCLEEPPVAETLRSLHESPDFFPTRLFVMEGK